MLDRKKISEEKPVLLLGEGVMFERQEFHSMFGANDQKRHGGISGKTQNQLENTVESGFNDAAVVIIIQ